MTDAWASDFQPPGLGEKGTLSRQPQETETPPEKPWPPTSLHAQGTQGDDVEMGSHSFWKLRLLQENRSHLC